MSEAPSEDVRQVWGRNLRWFGAEFLVVVTGVLVALAFNAWWGARQEAARERAYLRQIHAELTRTEQELASEIARATRLFDNAARLHGAFFAPEPPPADSMRQLWIVDHADPEPVLGTLHAIVATGDLQLVRDDSVRAALVWLGDRASYYDLRFRRWENMIVGTFQTLVPQAFVERTLDWDDDGRPALAPGRGASWAQAMDELPAQLRRPPFTDAMADPLDDQETYSAAVTYLLAQWNHRRNQERLLEDVQATRRTIEDALAR